ncbi:HesA/MoeB/ThiF family protein [Pseudochelatococcus sp. G4_1912]|uniref:HesA/MoeB/ThiF family protein n=1 Tax=Pseudochelatococcus sp. G4_1912 TaxID=3114288 RepID=UPI0039C6F417
MSFSDDEIERYARHIVMRDIGGPGQTKLKRARVLVIGAGGLGAPVLSYLAAAGVGKLGIVDDDMVSLSNLQRQIIHGTSDIGRLKTESAKAAIHHLNPHVEVACHTLRLDASNAPDIIRAYDVIADGSDNFATRYLVADICHAEKKPLIAGAMGQFDASLTTLRPFETAPDGRPYPSYRTLFPEPPAPGTTPTCEEAGVLGALPGIVGSMMALEVIRAIVGFGDSLVGKLLVIDTLTMRFETLRY